MPSTARSSGSIPDHEIRREPTETDDARRLMGMMKNDTTRSVRSLLVLAACSMLISLVACGGASAGTAASDASSIEAPPSSAEPLDSPSEQPKLDPRVQAVIETGPAAHGVTVGFGSVWVANHHGGSVTRIDPDTNEVVATIPLGEGPGRLTTGYGYVWVDDYNGGGFWRIDPKTNRAQKLWAPSTSGGWDGVCGDPVAGEGAVWAIGGPHGPLFKVNPSSGRVIDTAKIDGCGDGVTDGSVGLAVGAGSLWVGSGRGSVIRVDPETFDVQATIETSGGSIWVGPSSFGDGALWVTQLPRGDDFDNGLLLRIDPATNRVTARTPLGFGPGDTCVAGGSVWALNGTDGTVSQIDPSTARVRRTIDIGGTQDSALACGFGSVWATQFNESAVVRIAA
jgi:YVTN family beta-propeller protein